MDQNRQIALFGQVFANDLPVHINVAVANFDRLARQANDAFDEDGVGMLRPSESDDFPTPRRATGKGRAVDQQAIAFDIRPRSEIVGRVAAVGTDGPGRHGLPIRSARKWVAAVFAHNVPVNSDERFCHRIAGDPAGNRQSGDQPGLDRAGRDHKTDPPVDHGSQASVHGKQPPTSECVFMLHQIPVFRNAYPSVDIIILT